MSQDVLNDALLMKMTQT